MDFETTRNLFIEGDNLDALKLLQENYLGEVGIIYIDPPYNTGSNFIYDDQFAEDTETFLVRSLFRLARNRDCLDVFSELLNGSDAESKISRTHSVE